MASLRNDAWFAGFAAGEACFLISPRNRTRFAPSLAIALRVDDLAILDELRNEFGGKIFLRAPRGRNNGAAVWTVVRKHDLAGLVRYFDQFPLRAKKAADFVIWRRAVSIYCADGSTSPDLLPLREALIAGRKFDGDEPDFVRESCQLRLVS